jgi:hypothetical protein
VVRRERPNTRPNSLGVYQRQCCCSYFSSSGWKRAWSRRLRNDRGGARVEGAQAERRHTERRGAARTSTHDLRMSSGHLLSPLTRIGSVMRTIRTGGSMSIALGRTYTSTAGSRTRGIESRPLRAATTTTTESHLQHPTSHRSTAKPRAANSTSTRMAARSTSRSTRALTSPARLSTRRR